MSGKLRTLVWKTGVLTITQRPLIKSFRGFNSPVQHAGWALGIADLAF
jgi:hypothetical protein